MNMVSLLKVLNRLLLSNSFPLNVDETQVVLSRGGLHRSFLYFFAVVKKHFRLNQTKNT